MKGTADILTSSNRSKAKSKLPLKNPKLKGHQLFFTGHSLGGALAITATRFLSTDITGACYTFGSPPVGTVDFDIDITTPIYRIINHVDIVPRLPNPILVLVVRCLAVLTGVGLDMFGGLSKTIRNSAWYKKFSQLLTDAQKYRQSGYSSYLVGEGSNARLRYSVGPFDKFWLVGEAMGQPMAGRIQIVVGPQYRRLFSKTGGLGFL